MKQPKLMAGKSELLHWLICGLAPLPLRKWGMYPFMLERFEMLYNMHKDAAAAKGMKLASPSDVSHLMRNYRDYTDNVFVDTHSMDRHAIKCAAEILGEDKILFGSDMPITPQKWGMERGIAQIRDADLSDAAKEKIFSGNAIKLLDLADA